MFFLNIVERRRGDEGEGREEGSGSEEKMGQERLRDELTFD